MYMCENRYNFVSYVLSIFKIDKNYILDTRAKYFYITAIKYKFALYLQLHVSMQKIGGKKKFRHIPILVYLHKENTNNKKKKKSR